MAMRITFLLALGIFAVASPAEARRLEDWPYDKLMKEADLVVIARAVKTVETKDELGDPDWKKFEFVGQNTTFEVLATLKGKVDENQIQVLHFKLPDGHSIADGPCFVAFRTKPIGVNLKNPMAISGPPDYLLYLKRMKDGRYEPVSGRIDPALAVREMTQPSETLSELALSAAPVPPAAKPAFEIELKLDSKKGPLDGKFATVEIRNNTGKDLELRSNLAGGPLVFLDNEVRDTKDKRVSKEFYSRMVSSPYSIEDTQSVGTIPAGKSLTVAAYLFHSLEEKDRVPGKFKVRVRFQYDKGKDKVNVVTDWLTIELTEEHLKK